MANPTNSPACPYCLQLAGNGHSHSCPLQEEASSEKAEKLPTADCQVPIAEWEKEVEERIEAQQLQAQEVASSTYIPDRAVEAVEVALEAIYLANLCHDLAREKADVQQQLEYEQDRNANNVTQAAWAYHKLSKQLDAANAKLKALTGALERIAEGDYDEKRGYRLSAVERIAADALRDIQDPKTALTGEKEAT